jgi:hypothetical protein
MKLRAPKPRPHATLDDPDEVPAVRELHCRRYDQCLTLAEAREWAGFACTACAAFEPQTAEQEAADHLGLLRIFGRAGADVVFHEAATRTTHHTEEG